MFVPIKTFKNVFSGNDICVIEQNRIEFQFQSHLYFFTSVIQKLTTNLKNRDGSLVKV